jgi:O-antigen ligase
MSRPAPAAGAADRPDRAPGGARSGMRNLARRLNGAIGGGDWISRLVGLAALIGTGVVLGAQYLSPNKRVIAVIAAIGLGGIVWRLSLISGVGLLITALPYPRGTVFGSTNVVLVLALLLIWMLRVSLRQSAPPRRTPVDAPMLALLGAFIISFYNIDSPLALSRALENFLHLLAGYGMFYLIVNSVRHPGDLERLHLFQCASIAVVGLFGIYEINHPSGVLIPGWIEFRHNISDAVNIHNVRIGGPFFDFELLSEYCAINILLVGLLLVRARSGARRMLFGGLLTLTLFIMFATVTRGGIISLIIGLLYIGWLQRHRLRIVPLALALVAAAAGLQALNFYVANFTHSGDLFARMTDPTSNQFEYGMPTARLELWRSALERMMLHPIIGHGPVYMVERGLSFWYWPHNGYLFIGNLVGILGLSCFLWLLWRLWRISRPPGSDLRDPNYARAYLIIAHVQMLVFMVDQMKIDFLRIPTYAYQVWLLFAMVVAGHKVSSMSSAAPETAGR